MQRTAVSSSNIASIGYDAPSLTLEVEFRHGAVYQYYRVPEALFRGLMSAESHGSYLDTYIKKGGFRYRQIS